MGILSNLGSNTLNIGFSNIYFLNTSIIIDIIATIKTEIIKCGIKYGVL